MTVLNMLSNGVHTKDFGSKGFFMVKHIGDERILVQTCVEMVLSRIEEYKLDLYMDTTGWFKKGFQIKDRVFYIDEFTPLN